MTPDLDTQPASLEGECSPEEFRAWLREEGRNLKNWDEFWIDLRGVFWPCDEFMKHGFVAETVLGNDGEKIAEKMGWLRVSDYGCHCKRPLNQPQQDKLWDWCNAVGKNYQEMLSGITIL